MWTAIMTGSISSENLDLLDWDHALARLAHIFGSVLILATFAWGGYLLWHQFRMLRSEKSSAPMTNDDADA